MKRRSEADFGDALRQIDLPLVVFKPSDDMRNVKPCDYLVWWRRDTWDARSFWFECKDVDAVGTFNFRELRPSQRKGALDASRVGIPYWLAVYWRNLRSWTLSDTAAIVAAYDGFPPAVTRTLLSSRFGIDAAPTNLSSVIKEVLYGRVP